jgi:hypothetical protein
VQGRGPSRKSKEKSMIFQKRKTDLKTRKIAYYLENLLAKYGLYLLIGWFIMMIYGIGGGIKMAEFSLQSSD